jgi:RHS repeat-associated protein
MVLPPLHPRAYSCPPLRQRLACELPFVPWAAWQIRSHLQSGEPVQAHCSSSVNRAIDPKRTIRTMVPITDQEASQSDACLAPKALCWPAETVPEYPQASYNRARYYDPSAGRFLRVGPIGPNEVLNLYPHTSNNPITNADPSQWLAQTIDSETVLGPAYAVFACAGLDSTSS